MENMIGHFITSKRSNRVLPLLSIRSSVKPRKVSIDPLLLFQRICLNKKFDEHLCEYLQYELSPYPLALFTEAGMRKTNKKRRFTHFKSCHIELD